MTDSNPEYADVKKRAQELLGQNLSPADQATLKTYMDAIDARAATAADAERLLDHVTQKAAELQAHPLQRWIDAFQTPPFYFFFGLFLLIGAFFTSQYELNSSLTFLVAMLGVAVLLYGTGSQAAGTFGADTAAAQALLKAEKPGEAVKTTNLTVPAANIAIAGGAAVLTAFFAWGVINESPRIRQVFRDYDQYTRVRVELCYVGVSGCADAAQTIKTESPGDLKQAGLPPDVMDQIRSSLWLETGLGQKAFLNQSGDALEFIVFNRDLGNERRLKLGGATADENGYRYAAKADFFAIGDSDKDKNKPCLLQGLSDQTCSVIVEVNDAYDIDRIPRLVLRVVIWPEATTPNISDTGEQLANTLPFTPL